MRVGLAPNLWEVDCNGPHLTIARDARQAFRFTRYVLGDIDTEIKESLSWLKPNPPSNIARGNKLGPLYSCYVPGILQYCTTEVARRVLPRISLGLGAICCTVNKQAREYGIFCSAALTIEARAAVIQQ